MRDIKMVRVLEKKTHEERLSFVSLERTNICNLPVPREGSQRTQRQTFLRGIPE